MKAFTVMRYTLMRVWRDSSSVTEQILFPLGLIFVLGTALGGAFEGRDLGPTAVAYLIDERTPATATVEAFLNREDVSGYLEAVEVPDLDEGRRLLADEEAFSVVHVTEGFGVSHGELAILQRSDNTLRTGIVQAVVRNYVHAANVSSAVIPDSGSQRFDYNPIPAVFESQEISREGRVPGAFDFYAVSMLVLAIMYVSGYAVDGMREDLLDPIGRRVRTTAISPTAHISGKLGAYTVTGAIQAAVIIVVTLLVFGAEWGTSPLILGLLVASIVVFAVSLGTLVLAILRDGHKAHSMVEVIVLGSMIASGGAIQFGTVGPAFRAFQRVLPHYQGQTAILATIYGGSPGVVAVAFGYFLGGAVLALAGTVFLARRNA